MPDGQVLEFDRVTKRFSDVTAVTDFSGRVEPGVVTGFLGPNGAGKTTTLRMLLGQIRPTSGTATIGGAQYSDLKHPARVIGAMHEDPGFRPRRSVERHLVLAAKANGIAASRVSEVISFVGLDGEAGTRIGALSLGMRQRLSAATALLGDPGALVLDEPANGLDPEGIRWMRMLIRGLADEGRTVLVSSHVLSEVEQVADEILVIAHGQRKFAGSLASLADPTSGPVIVDAADRAGLTAALTAAGFEFEVLRSGLTVRGSDARTIGAVAAEAGVALSTLQQRGPTLEDVFLDLVNDRPVQLRQPEAPVASVAAPAVADAVAVPVAADSAETPGADAAENAASGADAVENDAPGPDAAETSAGASTEATGNAGTAASAETEAVVGIGALAESEGTAQSGATAGAEARTETDAAAAPESGAEAEPAAADESAIDTAAADAAGPDTGTEAEADSDAGADAPVISDAAIDVAPMSATEATVAIPIITSHDSTADGDEDDITAGEVPSFAPVSAGEDRPLPGVSGLAAAAAGLSQTGDSTDTTPSPAVSSVWASIIAGRSLDGFAEDAQQAPAEDAASTADALSQNPQPESDAPAEAPADELPAGDSPTHESVAGDSFGGSAVDETPTDEHADAGFTAGSPADEATTESADAESTTAESTTDESTTAESTDVDSADDRAQSDDNPADEGRTDDSSDGSSTGETPNDAPSADQEPTDDTSAEAPSADEPPAEDAPAQESPADESAHAEHTPEDTSASEESGAEASDVITSVPDEESESEGEHPEHPRY